MIEIIQICRSKIQIWLCMEHYQNIKNAIQEKIFTCTEIF
jgi:hypothetical protein